MQMRFRRRLLLLVSGCAICLSMAHGMGRGGDAATLYELEVHADAVTALEAQFLSLIETAHGDERFDLYWTYNHLTGSWSQVESLHMQIEDSVDAESDAEEQSMRTTLRDQAQFVRWELGETIADLERSVPRIMTLDHLRANAMLRTLLVGVRITVDRLSTEQCAYVPCAAEP